MNYEGQICRAPMERSSYMLPVTVGCPYNRCKFCNLFRHLKYRELPVSQIEEELKRVKALGGNPKRIFLGDGNAFGLKTERLLKILELIKSYFPGYEAVNMDATVTSILKKSDEDLKKLHENGVRHLYLGIESGLEDVLVYMNKDHNLQQAYEAIERLQNAGLIYDAHIMTGIAGHERGMENAEALAEFFNNTCPAHIVNFSMFLSKEVPLYQDIKNGDFKPADEVENMKEEYRLLELLTGENASYKVKYDGFHDYIKVRTRGTLPDDRGRMLAHLKQEIKRFEGKNKMYSLVYGECPNLSKCDGNEDVWDV